MRVHSSHHNALLRIIAAHPCHHFSLDTAQRRLVGQLWTRRLVRLIADDFWVITDHGRAVVEEHRVLH